MINKSYFHPDHELLGYEDFQLNESLGLGTSVAIVLKGFDQLERRARMLDSFSSSNTKAKFLGRKNLREFTKGAIIPTSLDKDINGINRLETLEARDFIFHGDHLYICHADRIEKISLFDNSVDIIHDQMFGSLHTIAIYKENLLVTSPGFDRILEYKITSNIKTWEWAAWNAGFDESPFGTIRLDENKSIHIVNNGIDKELGHIQDFRNFGLPTTYRTTHVNGAIYSKDSDSILATFFHQGIIVSINKKSNTAKPILKGLKAPHGLRAYNDGYIITDTANGSWYMLNNEFKITKTVDFKRFPGKSGPHKDLEWIQYVTLLEDDTFVAVDAKRSALIVFSLDKKEYNVFNVDKRWSVQEVKALSKVEMSKLSKIAIGKRSHCI